jgi:hypothetical protein
MLKLIVKVRIQKPDGSDVYKDFPLDRIEFKNNKQQGSQKHDDEDISEDMKKILD